MFADYRKIMLYLDYKPVQTPFWDGPLEMPSYVAAEQEAFNSVVSDTPGTHALSA